MIPTVSLTFKDAARLCTKAVAEAARRQVSVSVAVTDAGGHLLRLERMDGAMVMSAAVAACKASTAAVSAKPTEFWHGRVNSDSALLSMPDLTAVTGGVPLVHGTNCVGAIGVAGAPTEIDALLAQIAADALTETD